jgi:hypothetical protein
MLCPSCGNTVEGAFCSRCGQPVQAQPYPPVTAPMYAVPPMPYVARVQQHIQTLGILWCVFGAYRLMAGLFGALFLMGMSRPGFLGGMGVHGFPFASHAFLGSLGIFVAVISMISAVLSFTVGYALLERKSWGRTLAMILAILQLIKIPFGTAIGIYTLWVLGPAASAAEYAAITDRT